MSATRPARPTTAAAKPPLLPANFIAALLGAGALEPVEDEPLAMAVIEGLLLPVVVEAEDELDMVVAEEALADKVTVGRFEMPVVDAEPDDAAAEEAEPPVTEKRAL